MLFTDKQLDIDPYYILESKFISSKNNKIVCTKISVKRNGTCFRLEVVLSLHTGTVVRGVLLCLDGLMLKVSTKLASSIILSSQKCI